jgi:hypothetical protein
MSPPEAMAAACAAGVQIAIDGTDLVLEASGPPPDAILDLLTRYKLGIVALLQCGRDGWPAQIEPVDADAIEERAGLAADRGRNYIASGLCRSLGPRFFARGAIAGRAKTGGPSSTNGRESPSSTAVCRAWRPRPVPSRAASPSGSTAIRCARRRTAALAAARPSKATTRCCRSEPSPPATPGFIRAAGRVGMPRGKPGERRLRGNGDRDTRRVSKRFR